MRNIVHGKSDEKPADTSDQFDIEKVNTLMESIYLEYTTSDLDGFKRAIYALTSFRNMLSIWDKHVLYLEGEDIPVDQEMEYCQSFLDHHQVIKFIDLVKNEWMNSNINQPIFYDILWRPQYLHPWELWLVFILLCTIMAFKYEELTDILEDYIVDSTIELKKFNLTDVSNLIDGDLGLLGNRIVLKHTFNILQHIKLGAIHIIVRKELKRQ